VFERFTDRARRVVVLAAEESRLLNHRHIGTEHILLGLIHEGEGVAAQVLVSLGIPLERARREVEAMVGAGGHAPSGHIPFTPRAKKVLELSLREALRLGHNYIGTEHLLLGVLREGEGVAAQVLLRLGGDLERVAREVVEQIEPGVADTPSGERIEWPAEMSEQEVVGRTGTSGVSHFRGVAGSLDSPVCPRCQGGLERTARIAVFDVPDASGETRPIRFVFCSACGEALLAADA
jgi:ATP-dependent Clp protease ATP-binding subunit ClpA